MNKLLFRLLVLLIVIDVSSVTVTHGQLLGSLAMTQTNCTRPLTVTITNGSGNYNIAWGVTPNTCSVPTNNSTAVLPSACTNDATYYVFVRDNVSGQIGYFERFVPKVTTGSFSVSFPNVITVNNDGINDYFSVMAAGNTSGPLNAHSYNFWVGPNPAGTNLNHSQNGSNALGLNSGIDLWHPSPSSVNSGMYYYSFTATNCSTSQEYHGWLQVIK